MSGLFGAHRIVPVALIVAALAFAAPVLAVSPDEVLKDVKLETRARAISGQLRCPKCQSESIDESNADIAKDLRLIVRERLSAGDSDEQVKNFLVARYGEFVLLRPSFNGQTVLLWTAPFVLLALGGLLVWRGSRGRQTARATSTSALRDDEQAALAALLKPVETAKPAPNKAK